MFCYSKTYYFTFVTQNRTVVIVDSEREKNNATN